MSWIAAEKRKVLVVNVVYLGKGGKRQANQAASDGLATQRMSAVGAQIG